jgi:hypothetical protein
MAIAVSQLSIDVERPLGGLEQFLSLADQHRSVHFAMATHIEGQTTIAAWRTALDTLQERHPFFSVGIERSYGGSPYFRADVNARIPLRVVANPEHANWQIEVARELATPFDAQLAPLVRAVLSHGANESIFILTAHHSIADGLSLTYAIRDLLRALSGKSLEPLPLTPPQELLVELSLQQGSGTQRPVESAPAERGLPVAFRSLYGALPSIDALRLTPELTSRLLELSRKEETTVHGALCAALALAGREVSSDWRNAPVRILSPFNLRKRIGIGEDCGLFVWAGVIPIEPHTHADFWDVARAAKSALTSQQSLEHVAIGMKTLSDAMPPAIDTYGASQILAQAFPCELLLTNLGKLPCEFDCGDLKLKALWGPAVFMGFEGEQTVGVTTTNGSLCLLHSSFTPLPWLLPRTERILRSVCEGEKPFERPLLRKSPLTMIDCGDRCRIQG